MKKLLCLVLTVAVILSGFAMCLSVSAGNRLDLNYRPDGTQGHEDIVGKVIDPILIGKDTDFAKSINELGYKNINDIADGNPLTPVNYADGVNDADDLLEIARHPWLTKSYISEDQYDDFISYYADDAMLGVDYDFLYNKDKGAYFWNYSRYKLENDPHIHENEVAAAVAGKRSSTCAMKGAYDACAEALNGYNYQYSSKETDKSIFSDIIEEKIIVYNSYTKQNEVHYNYYYNFDKGSFSLMRTNGNNQIINTISKTWKTETLFQNKSGREMSDNAIEIANFIRKLLNPNLQAIPADTVVFTDNKSIDAYDFFVQVSDLSGLDDILQDNWCNANNFDVKEVMHALGVNIDKNTLLNVETEKGIYMGARILTDMYREFYKNPVLYVEQLLQNFCKNYTYSFQRAVESLFINRYPIMSAKSLSGAYTYLKPYDGSELKSVDGLINFIADCLYVDNVDAGNKSAKKFSFAPLPTTRLVTATDIDELHLYMLCYFELNRVYENNAEIIESFITNLISKLRKDYVPVVNESEGATADVRDLVGDTEMVLRSLFTGELTMIEVLTFHLGILTSNTVTSFPTNFFSNIKNSIATLFQKFVEAMDSLMNLLFGWTEGIFGGGSEVQQI